MNAGGESAALSHRVLDSLAEPEQPGQPGLLLDLGTALSLLIEQEERMVVGQSVLEMVSFARTTGDRKLLFANEIGAV